MIGLPSNSLQNTRTVMEHVRTQSLVVLVHYNNTIAIMIVILICVTYTVPGCTGSLELPTMQYVHTILKFEIKVVKVAVCFKPVNFKF